MYAQTTEKLFEIETVNPKQSHLLYLKILKMYPKRNHLFCVLHTHVSHTLASLFPINYSK